MPLPRALPYLEQLVTLRLEADAGQSAAAAASGICEVTFDAGDETWLIDRIVVRCTSTSRSRVDVYEGEARDKNLRDSSTIGNDNVADEAQPILVRAGSLLRVRWSNCSLGAVGVAIVQRRVVALRGGFVQ